MQEKLLILIGLEGHVVVWKNFDNQVIKNLTVKS